MTKQSYETSEANLQTFLKARNNTTPQTIKTTEYDPAVKITAISNKARDAHRRALRGREVAHETNGPGFRALGLCVRTRRPAKVAIVRALSAR